MGFILLLLLIGGSFLLGHFTGRSTSHRSSQQRNKELSEEVATLRGLSEEFVLETKRLRTLNETLINAAEEAGFLKVIREPDGESKEQILGLTTNFTPVATTTGNIEGEPASEKIEG